VRRIGIGTRRENLSTPAATLITPHAAQDAIEARVTRLPTETRALDLCLGQTLRSDVYAERDNPPFDRVCMDGIAIDSVQFSAGLRAFRVQGTQSAGSPALSLAAPSNAIEVTTGAVLPTGADTVIPLEEYDVVGDVATVRSDASGEVFRNVARRGSDGRRDVPMLQAGARLGAREISVAAAAGLNRLEVARAPKIAVITTGDELIAPGQPIADHQVRDSNAYGLRAALREHGVTEVDSEHVADDKGLLERSLSRQLGAHDMLVVTGGIAHGKLDLVRGALVAVGVQEVFHQVAQRPGKPMWFGVGAGRQAVFGLPGNPVAALTCLRRYVVPAIARALGAVPPRPERVPLASPAPGARRLTHFVPVVLRDDDLGRVAAVPRPTHGSGDFLALAGTDGFVELPPTVSDLPADFVASFYRW
jgi:molybdopterin molybdotransferase